MKKVNGKIVLVDDEPYEKELLEKALAEKNWAIAIEYFKSVDEAVEHLKVDSDEVFLVISDMDMPGKNGMDFKKILDNDEYLGQKSIPFIFVTNTISREQVIEAYRYRVQGYFLKPMTLDEQAQMFEVIVKYWITCKHPVKDDLPANPNLGSR